MTLHFLQQTQPPVLPCLQELYDHDQEKPQVLVDNWNTWFFDGESIGATAYVSYVMR